MAQKKHDGVVEAVRYTPEGKVKLVRVYLRRGPTWSDLMLMTREDFITVLKTGKRMMAGKRVDFMGGTFEVSNPVEFKGQNGQEMIYIAQPLDDRDNLEGVPLF
jgi:hypothetical protein